MRSLYRRNTVLQAIAPAYRTSFVRDLERVTIDAHDRLSAIGERLERTCFPTGAVVSALCGSNGKSMEVHGVGREGVLGPNILYASGRTRFDWVCQIGGSMLCMPSSLYERHLRTNAGLQQAIALYSMGTVSFLTQSVACNGLHTIAQRCARWLLITGDRVDATEFSLTHELLARMFGVQRSGVSLAVHRLQRLGIIRYRLGHVAVLDRRRLESESCECYRVVVRETKGIFRAR